MILNVVTLTLWFTLPLVHRHSHRLQWHRRLHHCFSHSLLTHCRFLHGIFPNNNEEAFNVPFFLLLAHPCWSSLFPECNVPRDCNNCPHVCTFPDLCGPNIDIVHAVKGVTGGLQCAMCGCDSNTNNSKCCQCWPLLDVINNPQFFCQEFCGMTNPISSASSPMPPSLTPQNMMQVFVKGNQKCANDEGTAKQCTMSVSKKIKCMMGESKRHCKGKGCSKRCHKKGCGTWKGRMEKWKGMHWFFVISLAWMVWHSQPLIHGSLQHCHIKFCFVTCSFLFLDSHHRLSVSFGKWLFHLTNTKKVDHSCFVNRNTPALVSTTALGLDATNCWHWCEIVHQDLCACSVSPWALVHCGMDSATIQRVEFGWPKVGIVSWSSKDSFHVNVFSFSKTNLSTDFVADVFSEENPQNPTPFRGPQPKSVRIHHWGQNLGWNVVS